jgi:hypothetical protein
MKYFCSDCDRITTWVLDPEYRVRLGSRVQNPYGPPSGYACGNCLRKRRAERARIEKKTLAAEHRASERPVKRPTPANIVKQLESLNELFRQGALTKEQFETAKNHLLGLGEI